jgi:hypothetical protein
MAYVAAHEGLPLGLQFRRGSFGPFSPDLKRMQTVLINNGLIKETQSGNMFEVRVGQTFAASASTYIKDLAPWEPIIARIASLFLRLNTRRAEILATVMFAADELRDALNRAPTERELFESIMQWKLRRDPPFPAEQVATSVRELASMGWLAIESSSDLPVPIHASVDA